MKQIDTFKDREGISVFLVQFWKDMLFFFFSSIWEREVWHMNKHEFSHNSLQWRSVKGLWLHSIVNQATDALFQAFERNVIYMKSMKSVYNEANWHLKELCVLRWKGKGNEKLKWPIDAFFMHLREMWYYSLVHCNEANWHI